MNFRFTPEQAAFQDEVSEFIARGLPSGWDERHAVSYTHLTLPTSDLV